MPPPSDAPLRKTTINLYLSDIEALERLYGRGWQEAVRNLVKYHVKEKTRPIEDWTKAFWCPYTADHTCAAKVPQACICMKEVSHSAKRD